jgi:hypothetical protein
MAAVLGSVLGAPLTAIVFAFGLTHAGNALLPLIATTSVAYGVNVLWMKRSIMTEKIARRGLHVHREYGVDPLERVHVDDLMSRPRRWRRCCRPVQRWRCAAGPSACTATIR